MTPEEQLIIQVLTEMVDKHGPRVLFGALAAFIKDKPELKGEAQKALAAAKVETAREGGGAALLVLGALALGGKKRGGRR